MALTQKALQRKREKKKRHVRVASPFSPMAGYRHWPLYECWMPTELWETGIGQTIISRRNNQGDIAVGIYLIDIFCLGVKNCFVRFMQENEYQDTLEHLRGMCGEIKRVEPSYANTLIHKAIEYAQQFGFKPHKDFSKAKKLLENIPLDENQKFIFGKDGLPYYMQGPDESPIEVRRILQTLKLNAGK